MTRVYKPFLLECRENVFLILSLFVTTSIPPSVYCPARPFVCQDQCAISHLVTVPSTHSHCKFLLASSKTDPPRFVIWLSFLFFSPSSPIVPAFTEESFHWKCYFTWTALESGTKKIPFYSDVLSGYGNINENLITWGNWCCQMKPLQNWWYV